MRTGKIMLLLCVITFLSLIYVWQQTEIFRIAYEGQKNLGLFEDLLDKNTLLRYNIKTRGSLIQIGDKVSQESDFQMPDSYRLVRLNYTDKNLRLARQASKEGILSRFFSIKRQAEAKTITNLRSSR